MLSFPTAEGYGLSPPPDSPKLVLFACFFCPDSPKPFFLCPAAVSDGTGSDRSAAHRGAARSGWRPPTSPPTRRGPRPVCSWGIQGGSWEPNKEVPQKQAGSRFICRSVSMRIPNDVLLLGSWVIPALSCWCCAHKGPFSCPCPFYGWFRNRLTHEKELPFVVELYLKGK